jgi:hypothetical protein
MLSGIDFLIIAVFVSAILVEMKRGFGKALFDFAALLLAIHSTSLLLGPLAGAVKVSSHAQTNETVLYAGLFVVMGSVLLYLGSLVYSTSLISADYFDPILGALCGLGIAIVVAHGLARAITLYVGADAAILQQSSLGVEMLDFTTYHRIMDVLYNFDR